MKVKLRIARGRAPLFESTYEISDAGSFGKAFTDVWLRLRQEQFDRETSVGSLMDQLDNNVLEKLDGAQIHLERR